MGYVNHTHILGAINDCIWLYLWLFKGCKSE